MTQKIFRQTLFITVFLAGSCKNRIDKDLTTVKDSDHGNKKVNDTTQLKDSARTNDYVFVADSLLYGHKTELRYYFRKYGADTCPGMKYAKSDLKQGFEGINFIGDINHNKIKDSVFVLRPLSFCDKDGEAYYFTDTTLPRLETDSYCCHPDNLFVVGDIDEDGVSEIGQYYSSCVSRYKSLYVYSLKNNAWKQIGHCVFDLYYSEKVKNYKSYVRKTAKGKFEMLEITGLTGKMEIGKKNWLKFTL